MNCCYLKTHYYENGAAAKLIKKGEIVIIIGFEITDKPVRSKTVIVNSDNKIEELIES